MDKRLVFVPFSRKTLLSYKSENTTRPSVKCGFRCFACRLFTGSARVKRGEAKTTATTTTTKVESAYLREALGGADSVLHGSKQNASAARRNWHFAQFYKSKTLWLGLLPRNVLSLSRRQNSALKKKEDLRQLPIH